MNDLKKGGFWALPLIQNDPFVLISNDPWDAQLVSQQC
jgi:hypothetical protein